MTTKPTNDLGFARAVDLYSFEGCFSNRGETGADGSKSSLSSVIWPHSDLDHKRIDTVKVQVEAPDVLLVSALTADHVVREDRFVAGTDFRFESGRISVISHARASSATEPGNPFIGVYTESTELGVDAAGDARMVEAANMLGTAFLVVPTIGRISDVTRFRKLGSSCDGS